MPEVSRTGAALVIGISGYPNGGIARLKYAARDARAVARLLADREVCGFSQDRVRVLLNEDAGRDEVVRGLSSWLPESARGADIAFLYFAGHGTVRVEGQKEEGYLLPFDADPDNLAGRGVAMRDVTHWVETIQARAVVVCLDCCHAAKVLTRDGDGSAAPRSIGLRPSVLPGLMGEGRFLIASCGEEEASLESPQLKHGLFTHHFLKGIEGEADRDRDGKVGVAELFEYVAAAVEKDARERFGKTQKPWRQYTDCGGVYLSLVRPKSEGDSVPALAAVVEKVWRREGAAAAVEEAGRRIGGAAEEELLALLRLLRSKADAAALPLLFGCLAHRSEQARRQALLAVEATGWQAVAAAAQRVARQGDAQESDTLLEALAALPATADLVTLLNHLTDLFKGNFRARCIYLLDRKRLSLDLEGTRKLFREMHSPYRLERVLGQGLYTAAYLARHEQAEHDVVIRVLRPEFVAQPLVRAQFLDISRFAFALVHHNLVRTLDVQAIPERNVYYAIRDYVDGVTLQRLLEKGRTFDAEQTVRLLRQIAEALTPLHRRGRAHGGVKPSNIFVCEDGRVVLGDPSPTARGIGVALDRLAYDYRYFPPEAFRGCDAPGPAGDFYSLGCVGYELACGRPPFVSENCHELIVLHDREGIAAPASRDSSLPARGNELLLRLLAKSPEGRYASLDDLLAALDHLLRPERSEGGPTAGPGSPGPGPSPPPQVGSSGENAPPTPDMPVESFSQYHPMRTIRADRDESRTGISGAPKEKVGESPAPPLDENKRPFPSRFDELRQRFAENPVVNGPQSAEGTVTNGPEPPVQPAGEVSEFPEPHHGTGGVPNYKLLRKLGDGEFGEVFLAEAPGGIHVAVKRSKRRLDDEASIREVSALEALRKLRHPFLLPIHASWLQDGQLHIAMALAEDNLQNRFQECRRQGFPGIPLDELLRYFDEVAGALDYLHGQNVAHRDIKPANLVLLSGHAMVADFGLVRFLDAGRADATVCGTPRYMAPEVWRGKFELGSDQYSLASTYVEMRLGRPAIPGSNPFEILMQQTKGEADLTGLPETERQALARALANNPEDRYPSCSDFVEALRLATAPPPPPPPAAKPAFGPWAALAICFVGLCLVCGVIFWRSPRLPAVLSAVLPDGFVEDPEAGTETVGEKQYWKRIRTDRAGTAAWFRLIPAPPNGVRPFYLMERKVSRGQFRTACADPRMQELLNKYAQQDPRASTGSVVGLVAGELLNEYVQRDPQAGVFPNEWRKKWKDGGADDRLPATYVNVTEAHCFAEWLAAGWPGGGRSTGCLPSRNEWDKAGGGYDNFSAPFDPSKGGKPALERGPQPRPVDRADAEQSVFGCYDMGGNVQEFTRTLGDGREVPVAGRVPKDLRVILRGAEWGSQGFRFRYNDGTVKEPEPALYNDARNDIGFRVAIELP